MHTPARFSIIEAAHKGIRNALSQWSLQAGATDYTNMDEVAELRLRTATILAMLEEHAHSENTLILPLLDGKVPAGAVHDAEDHEAMDAQQNSLLQLLDRIQQEARSPHEAAALGHQFYQDLSLIHAAHLQHMIEEERGSQVLLWEHYSDDELRQVHAKILQKLDPALRGHWMEYIVPALNKPEREKLVTAQKTSIQNA
jgi:hypothetical protein